MSKVKNYIQWIVRLPGQLVIGLISIYQKTLSPDHSPFMKPLFPHGYCKYHPSCSQYTKQAIEQKGLIRGFFLGFWRVLRCNPWSKGGVDEIKN